MGPAEVAPLPTAGHFTLLIYSFRHPFSDAGRLASFRALAGRWRHWWSRLDDRELGVVLDDIYFFLPHVQRMLFPEALLLPADAGARLAEARRLAGLPPDEVARRVPTEATLRLSYDPGRLAPLRDLELSYVRRDRDGAVREQFSAPFEVSWVDAALFPQQVGLLILKVSLREPSPTVARINDFHYYLRAIHAPRLGWQLAEWRPAGVPEAVPCGARDVVDYLLQGLTDRPDLRSPSPASALGDLGRAGEAARVTATPFGQVYGQSFRLYQYSCLAGSGPPDGPVPPFVSAAERALYELATCTDTRLEDYRPDPSYLRRLMDRHRIAFWDNWQAMALHDNVAFLGLREGGFTLRDLAHNVENDYFSLYLITLFYKDRLTMLSGELVGRQGPFGDRVRRARRLWEEFRNFQDDYWFAEVTRKPQGIELHRCFREGLGIGAVFEELRAKVREFQEFHEYKVERQISELLAFLTVIGVPAGVVTSLFGSALGIRASWTQFGAALLVSWLVLGLIWVAWCHRDEISADDRDRFGPGP